MDLDKLGSLIITLGTLLNISGAILNALHVPQAFVIWMLSNSLCAIFFIGAERGLWTISMNTDRKMAAMYLFFLGTSIIGWFYPEIVSYITCGGNLNI